METVTSVGLKVPPRFGGQMQAAKPHVAHCQACGDFGTLVIGDGARFQPHTMPNLMRTELPCTCASGDFWRALLAEWRLPIPPKAAKWPVAVVIDEPYKRPEPLPIPQAVRGEAQRMLGSLKVRES